jgi:hypothetical protein
MSRYNMCTDQPAQIDCRNTRCKFHTDKGCSNVSPALTISPQPGGGLDVRCWSFEEKPKCLTERILEILRDHTETRCGITHIGTYSFREITEQITKLIKDENPG